MLSRAFRNSSMVENNGGRSSLLGKLNPRDGLHPSWPIERAPGMDDEFVACEFFAPEIRRSTGSTELASVETPIQ